MQTLLVYAGLVLAPTAAFALARRWVERWTSGPRRRPREPGPPDPGQLVRLAAHLRRLDDELRALDPSGSPGAATRRRALQLGYDDVLRECCAALGMPDPGRGPLPAVTRLQVEADLVRHGLEW